MELNLEMIRKLSRSESKTLIERFVKLSEECGELAQEILIDREAPGFGHKSKSQDGISGEVVDVLLVAFSIYFAHGGTVFELRDTVQKKCEKWQKHQG